MRRPPSAHHAPETLHDTRAGAHPLSQRQGFEAQFVALFEEHFPRVARILGRLSGEPDLAADLTQEAFVRLYERGALPDTPVAWLLSVALNLFRNGRTTASRRTRLLTVERGARVHADPPLPADERVVANEVQQRVRRTIDALPERERQLLLLRAEGYSYRDLALALQLSEASVGVMLMRAKRAFRDRYEERPDAS